MTLFIITILTYFILLSVKFLNIKGFFFYMKLIFWVFVVVGESALIHGFLEASHSEFRCSYPHSNVYRIVDSQGQTVGVS